MLEKAALSRLVFAFALVCAAVVSFNVCSDAARASPILTQVDNGVKHKVLRRPYTPYSHHSHFTGLLPTETGLQTGTNDETEARGNYREGTSIIDHQSNPLRFTESSFGYSQNSPDNRQSQAGMTRVQSDVRPASSMFTSHSQHGGQSFKRLPSRVNYHSISQKVAQSGNSYNSFPVIIRKSSHKEAAGPPHHSSRPSQVWDPVDAQKSYNNEKAPGNGSSKASGAQRVWQPSDSSLFSSQSGRYWGTSLPTSRQHYRGHKEANELAEAGPQSTFSGIQSSQLLGFASQTAPRAPSVSNSLDASVIKRIPSPEKLTSSITDFSKALQSVSGSETPRYKKVQSYLFRDSQTSLGGHETVDTVTGGGPSAFPTTPHKRRPSDAQVYRGFSPNVEQLQQPQVKDPTEEAQPFSSNASPLHHSANVAQYGAQTDSFAKYQRTTTETLAEISVNPAPGKDNTMGSFVPIPHTDFQDSYISAVSSPANAETRRSMHADKPGQTIKQIHGFRGLKNPSAFSSRGSNERTNSGRYRFNNVPFKNANIYPSLKPKYNFGQRGASPLTTTPAKVETTSTDYSPPSTGTLDMFQTLTSPRLLTPGFKEARPLLLGSDAGMDSNPDRRLRGFATRPHEGAKASVSEPHRSATALQGFDSFRGGNSQIWQPKSSRIHKWYNKAEPGSHHVSSMNQNELSSEDHRTLLKKAGSTESVRFTPDKYKKDIKLFTSLGFHPVQNRHGNASNKTHQKDKEQRPTIASSNIVSSAYFRSAGDVKVQSSLKSKPRPLGRPRTVAMTARLFNRSTSSTVKGSLKKPNESTPLTSNTGNAAIVRLPTRPDRIRAVTYTDILGSASFSGVRATTRTPITPADTGHFPNTTATTEQKDEALNFEDAAHGRGNASRGPGSRAEGGGDDDDEDFSSVEEDKLGVRSEEADRDTQTSDLFRDNEGSGSGGFNAPGVLSADGTKRWGLREDWLELAYLRTSTENISFKSMKLSQPEK